MLTTNQSGTFNCRRKLELKMSRSSRFDYHSLKRSTPPRATRSKTSFSARLSELSIDLRQRRLIDETRRSVEARIAQRARIGRRPDQGTKT
jgi:hypothetical protein